MSSAEAWKWSSTTMPLSSSRPEPSRNPVSGSTPTPTTARNASISWPEAVTRAGQRAAVRAELLDLLAEQQLDAVLAVELRDLVRELLRGECRHEVVALLDERDLEPEHAQRGGDLGADEAAADDEDLARLGRLLRRARRHRRACGRSARRAGRHRGRESVRGCAPLAITSVPYGSDSPPASCTVWAAGVDRLDRGVEAQLDDEVVVLLGLVHERVVRLHLPAQHALRERRPVVRRQTRRPRRS